MIIVGLVLGISLQFVRAWTEPTDAPPNGNVGAPINTSALTQIKAGILGVVGLVTNSFQLTTGAPQPGYVLTSSDTFGNATWQPSSGGSGTPGSQAFTSSGTWHSPPGVTKAWFTLVGGGGGGARSGYWGGTGFPGYAGQVVQHTHTVVPNTDYNIIVGSGGGAGSDACGFARSPECTLNDGKTGKESSVAGVLGAIAPGGAGGQFLDSCPPLGCPPLYPRLDGLTNGTGHGTGGNGAWGSYGQAGYILVEW